jgi:hypothetical protein
MSKRWYAALTLHNTFQTFHFKLPNFNLRHRRLTFTADDKGASPPSSEIKSESKEYMASVSNEKRAFLRGFGLVVWAFKMVLGGWRWVKRTGLSFRIQCCAYQYSSFFFFTRQKILIFSFLPSRWAVFAGSPSKNEKKVKQKRIFFLAKTHKKNDRYHIKFKSIFLTWCLYQENFIQNSSHFLTLWWNFSWNFFFPLYLVLFDSLIV